MAMEVYYDKVRDQQNLYVVLSENNETQILALLISPKGSFTKIFPKKISNCISYLKATELFLIYSCPQQSDKEFIDQGKIYVALRSNYETVFEIAGSGNSSRFGTDIQTIESHDGL